MKRSEMVTFLNKVLKENYYSSQTDWDLANLLLINLEDQGMLPPSYENFIKGNHMDFYEINEWEPEDNEKE